MEEDVVLACHKIQKMLHDKDKIEEKTDETKSRSSNRNVKVARKIVLSLFFCYLLLIILKRRTRQF